MPMYDISVEVAVTAESEEEAEAVLQAALDNMRGGYIFGHSIISVEEQK